MCEENIPDPLIVRYRRVRAAFVVRGTTFNAWCAQEGITRQNATKALLGDWRGPKAEALVDKLLRATETGE